MTYSIKFAATKGDAQIRNEDGSVDLVSLDFGTDNSGPGFSHSELTFSQASSTAFRKMALVGGDLSFDIFGRSGEDIFTQISSNGPLNSTVVTAFSVSGADGQLIDTYSLQTAGLT